MMDSHNGVQIPAGAILKLIESNRCLLDRMKSNFVRNPFDKSLENYRIVDMVKQCIFVSIMNTTMKKTIQDLIVDRINRYICICYSVALNFLTYFVYVVS